MSLYQNDSDQISSIPWTNHNIILDIDETLVHSENDMNKLVTLNIFNNPKYLDLRQRIYILTLDDVLSKRGTGTKNKMWGTTRPHLKEFLIFCFSYFKIVSIWSAGKERYVNSVVDNIFKHIRDPHVVYTWNECFVNDNGLITKPIQTMINNVPDLNDYMSINNTLVIDDRPSTFYYNNRNGITIPRYHPSLTIEGLRQEDNALLKLMNWLKQPEVIFATNLLPLDKSNIFT